MKDEPTKIQLIVRVTDGSFESSLSLPVASTPEEHNEFAKIWVGAMATAFNGSWVNAPASPSRSTNTLPEKVQNQQ